MQNLARNRNCSQGDRTVCDAAVLAELALAGIPIEKVTSPFPEKSEVPYEHIGRLGSFTFYRNWYYWSASGPMPLKIAKELYADRIGAKDVRVAGHCGCPSPEEHIDSTEFGDFVNLYHIDSQEGLNLFAATIKKYGLDKIVERKRQENRYAVTVEGEDFDDMADGMQLMKEIGNNKVTLVIEISDGGTAELLRAAWSMDDI